MSVPMVYTELEAVHRLTQDEIGTSGNRRSYAAVS